MTGAELIAAERQRQIDVEGYTSQHDDHDHEMGELAAAAMCYAVNAVDDEISGVVDPSVFIEEWWPWASQEWKPKDSLSDLVRAGALIAAEIDRLQRKG